MVYRLAPDPARPTEARRTTSSAAKDARKRRCRPDWLVSIWTAADPAHECGFVQTWLISFPTSGFLSKSCGTPREDKSGQAPRGPAPPVVQPRERCASREPGAFPELVR